MELRRIDKANLWKILDLSAKEEQTDFVAANTQSILEAYAAIASGDVALPFGIYRDGRPVHLAVYDRPVLPAPGSWQKGAVPFGRLCGKRGAVRERDRSGKKAVRRTALFPDHPRFALHGLAVHAKGVIGQGLCAGPADRLDYRGL